jgi:hypothetical protein
MFEFSHSLLSLLLQQKSWGSVNVPVLQAEVTQAQEVATATEVTCVMAVLAMETFAQMAAAA